MTEQELTRAIDDIASMYTLVNARYLQRMGEHIRVLGKLTPTDIHRIEQYIRMGKNIDILKAEMASASGKTKQEIDKLIDRMIEDEYRDNYTLYQYRNRTFEDLASNIVLREHIQAILTLTNNSLTNVSNTTVASSSGTVDLYTKLVDKCIYSVSNGLDDYYSVIKEELKNASVGARVKYDRGITRRLDSAIRMNVIDGTKQIYDEVREQGGKIFGADGYELSAHALCAPDHLPIQGKQFSAEEYDKMQSNEPFKDYNGNSYQALDRVIGQWNCRHIRFPIILGISSPANSESMLRMYAENSTRPCTIDGKQYTKYQASQLMRQAETAMRYSKDGYILAKQAGDNELAKYYQDKLLAQQAKYRDICDKSGLPKDYKRAYVSGYSGAGNNSKS